MTQANPELSVAGKRMIATGAWQVDAERGRIYGKAGRLLQRLDACGYIKLKVRCTDGRQLSVMAHRVIWEHVHGPLDPALTINHLNGVKTDNRISNLEAVTVGDNVRHAVATGLRPGRKGVAAANAKLTDDQVRDIYRRCGSERVADLAREYGVAYWTVSGIKHGRAWLHVTGAASAA